MMGDQVTSASTAESVMDDFRQLLLILDAQLAKLPESEASARAHILEAKAVAERGLRLSEALVESLGR